MTKVLREVKSDNGVSDWIEINPKEGGESMENVIEIDGVKYREVKRKAAVGERILVVGEDDGSCGGTYYRKGNIATVSHVRPNGVTADFSGNTYVYNGGMWAIGHGDYVVLEPITEIDDIAASDVDLIVLQRELNSLRKQVDGLTGTIAKMATQLRVAREDIVLIEEGVADDIKRLEAAVFTQAASKTRDEIVAQAKRDVAELLSEEGGKYARYSVCGNVSVEFVVNREKRTVVALLRRAYVAPNEVIARGIAKAAPGDVFNVHIGRAIALRRALELEVPTEYTNAPQPEGVRVGDVVCHRDFPNEITVVTEIYKNGDVAVVPYIDEEEGEEVVGFGRNVVAVIDDSDRYNDGVPAK